MGGGDAEGRRRSRRSTTSHAERLARALRADAIEAGHAVLVGNLAGVVEWTDEAWVRLTAFPLDETIGKPIAHFLDRAGLERELVDFVAQHFLDGRPCTVELPFDRFDGHRLHVRLEVERSVAADDGTTRFIAVARALDGPVDARDVSDDPAPGPGTHAQGNAPHDDEATPAAAASRPAEVAARLDLNDVLRRAIEALRPRLAGDTLFEAIPEPGMLAAAGPSERPGARIDALLDSMVDALLDSMVDAVDAEAPFVSALSGRLAPGRSHHSAVHPIPARRTAWRARAGAFLELHDTGPHLDRAALERLAAGRPGDDPRERALDRARREAEALGAEWLLDSTPGCGTQQLVVFDAP